MRNRWKVIVGVVAAMGIASAGCSAKSSDAASAKTAVPKTGAPAERPVPVLASPVERTSVPVFLEGLGTVTAFNTVLVRSQVDGRIDRIAFREGQDVKTGELLAQIDPRPFQIQLRQADANLAKDVANLKNARLNLDRYKALRDQKLVPQQQADDQQAQVDQLEATIQADRAQIDNIKLQLTYAAVTSPIDGRTGVRMVDPGNIIHANDATGIVVITQLDPIAVLFTLPQDELPRVSEAMAKGKLTVEALSRDGKQSLGKGELLLVDNQINQTTATIRLKAIFKNPDKSLWPNQFVKARLLLSTRDDALVVPASALQRGPQGVFVFIVDGEQKAQVRAVEVDFAEGERAVIAHGLEPGELVIAEGQSRLAAGTRVQVRGKEVKEGKEGKEAQGSSPPSPSARRE
jgi:multidrug efflux system membrane fusion protein